MEEIWKPMRNKLGQYRKGFHPLTQFKKGQIPWNKGTAKIRIKKGYRPWNKGTGGRFLNSRGYVLIRVENHPFSDKHGYVREHRVVVERIIGRYLSKSEVVHHINKVKIDNNPKNLMAFINNAAHIRFERKGKVEYEEIIFNGSEFQD